MAKKSDPTWKKYHDEYQRIEDRVVAPFFSTPELQAMRKEMEAKKEDSTLEHSLFEFDETVGEKKSEHADVPVFHSTESYEKTEAQKSTSAKPEPTMKQAYGELFGEEMESFAQKSEAKEPYEKTDAQKTGGKPEPSMK